MFTKRAHTAGRHTLVRGPTPPTGPSPGRLGVPVPAGFRARYTYTGCAVSRVGCAVSRVGFAL